MKHILTVLIFTSSVFAMDSGTQQWDGAHYKHNSSPQFKAAMELLSMRDLSKCRHILDVGSGSGQVTAQMARIAPHAQVRGIDLNKSMVDEAQSTYMEIPNVSFHQVDAQQSDAFFYSRFSNNFDLVFSSAVFLWIEDKQSAFNNIHTVLKPGGHMLVRTSAPRPKDHPLNKALMALAQNPKWASFAQAYMSRPQTFPLSIDQAHQMIPAQKWTNISVTESGLINLYDSSEEFCSWMQGWMGAMPAVAALEKEKQIELSKDFVRGYLELSQSRNDAGKIMYCLPRIVIQADKK